MKRIILVLALLLLSSYVYADTERVTLLAGGSFLFDGKNITLVDTTSDSIIVCVNGEKTIISDEKTVSNVLIDVIDSSEGDARLKLDYECRDDCICNNDECNNNLCFAVAQAETTVKTTIAEEETTIEGERTTVANLTGITGEAVANMGEVSDVIRKLTYILVGVAIIIGVAAYSVRQDKEGKEEIDF